MEDDIVIYIQCPHCKRGWYGPFIDIKDHIEGDKHILDEFNIQGINPTNLTEPIHCLNCHNEYTPIKKELKKRADGEEIIVFKDCTPARMYEFVAKCVTRHP